VIVVQQRVIDIEQEYQFLTLLRVHAACLVPD